MKTSIVRLLSLLLLVALICSYFPVVPVNASSSLDPNHLLEDLAKERVILDSINKYFSSNSFLKKDTTIFFFEGGSNSKNSYAVGGKRDQAVAIVTKQGKITYIETKCSTIPDIPDKYYKTSPGAANVLDGIYKFVNTDHNGHSAFQIRTIKGGGSLPCVRFDSKEGTYGVYDNATGINIHGRKNCNAATSNSPNSSGCILVGDNWDTSFAKFRNNVKKDIKNTDHRYVVIDRTLAKTALSNSSLYSKYPHSVEVLLNLSVNSYIDINVKSIGQLASGASHNIVGTISSNCNITEVTGTILSGSTVKDREIIYPNTRAVDIKRSSINQNLSFGKLDDGSYTLQITVKNAKNKSKTIKLNFTVGQGASTLSVKLDSINSICQGSSHNITGTISSNYKITNITGTILSGSTTMQSKSISPNTKSVSLKDTAINSGLKFGKLAKGTYTLKITATDANKKTVTKKITFTVTDALTISLNSIGTISKGSAHNIVGTVSSTYKITKITGKILSGSTTMQSKSISPNKKSVSLKDTAINSELKFGKLSKGTYTLQITATDENKNTVTKKITFTVK